MFYILNSILQNMFNKLNIYQKSHTRHEVAEDFSVTSTRYFQMETVAV